MHKKSFQMVLIKWVSYLIVVLFIVLFLQLKIQRIKYQIMDDNYRLINRNNINRCLTAIEGRNFWFTKTTEIRGIVTKCDKWIQQVEVDKKLFATIKLKIYLFKPALFANVNDQCFLINKDLELRTIECNKFKVFSNKLPILTSRYSIEGHFDLLEQLLEFNTYCELYLAKRPKYKLEKYARRMVLVADFKIYNVILNPVDSGGVNFVRFFQTIKGLKELKIKYKEIVLLFDRVIIK